MSNNQPDNSDESERLTELVSYLDSELNETQMNEVELQLLEDSNLRSLADDLERTWGLLDSLEEVTASSQFTEQTLATVSSESLSAQSATSQAERPSVFARLIGSRTFRQATGCFVLGAVAAVAGLAVSRSVQPEEAANPDARILRNMELLRDYPKYLSVPNASKLEQLPFAESDDSDSGVTP